MGAERVGLPHHRVAWIPREVLRRNPEEEVVHTRVADCTGEVDLVRIHMGRARESPDEVVYRAHDLAPQSLKAGGGFSERYSGDEIRAIGGLRVQDALAIARSPRYEVHEVSHDRGGADVQGDAEDIALRIDDIHDGAIEKHCAHMRPSRDRVRTFSCARA